MITFVLLLLVSSCINYGTQFIRHENAKYYPSKSPCTPKVTIKIDESELGKWELIGICRSNMPTKGIHTQKNIAMDEILKCACAHGGDLVKIVESKEHIQYDQYNTKTSGAVASDEIKAEIYRKK